MVFTSRPSLVILTPALGSVLNSTPRQPIKQTQKKSKKNRTRYPLDAFISDYGWFTDAPNTPEQDDFGYNPATFPAPAEQLGLYHSNGIL